MNEAIDNLQREWNEMKSILTGRAAEEKARFESVLGDTKAKLEEYSARINALELAATRPHVVTSAGEDPEKAEAFRKHLKAFETFARKGERTPELKVLRAQNDTTGGFGISAEVDGEIIKGITEISPVRTIVRVRNTSKRSVRVMKRTGTFAAVWVGEAGTKTETTGLTYGMEEIPTHEVYAMVDISNQDLEDTDFDLVGELQQEFMEQFALAEGQGVISGNGVTRPEGFLTNAAVAQSVTGDANLITYAGFVSVSHAIKVGYLGAARFVFNLGTLGAARQLTSAVTGDPLWTPMAAGAPATILGFPYTILQDMPAIAANAFPVAFGDFGRAYRMVDRVALEVLRDPYTQASAGATRFIARKRLGGQVVNSEAIRKLKVSAA